jgi:hypothetical protein
MSRRRFEVFEYRQVLARMRQGDSDRDIASARLMGRGKLKTVRRVALDRGRHRPAIRIARRLNHDLVDEVG